ncbi:EVE domain-containing protein [Leucobacter sp. UCMA 4100]|uniref:EVE domain-containing protein n=1 Tax=Leucobacter sp. UCMA 4100 TaxID=2810534 RepID=UPI0022EA78D7|nr:EVE domain-containing protein [Leucobacter sp. UCMA 4100]MDA3148016.1 EVE domain-containing protein [Leucobacter sp. UCMA 4100]
MTRGWLGVVSAAHVRRGIELGIAQINHGKRVPLARMHAGDTLIYYSPTVQRGDRTPYRHFTAIGTLPDDEIWQADEVSFRPFRRRIDYLPGTPAPLDELRTRLHLTQEPNWGYQLRYGLIPLDAYDMQVIREAMQA